MFRWSVVSAWMLALLMATVSHGADEPSRAALPQDHPYQVVLRDYLATLAVSDFEVPLKPLEFDADWVKDDEQLHRLWIVARFHSRFAHLPSLRGVRMSPGQFTLNQIEGGEHILMRSGHRGGMRLRNETAFTVQPADTVWWSLWDYPGNPYHGSLAIRRRAFVMAAVDMMMLDQLHESGTHWVNNARRSDFLGGSLIWMGYVYHAVKSDLPTEVQAAYETGLAKFVDRLTQWGPTGVTDNMDMKTNVGLAYIAAAVGPGEVSDRARQYVQRNLRLVHPAGMIRDAGGLDASYNGIALVNLIWAAMVGPWPELKETVEHMSDLKGHLTFPEPDGQFFGPSHFSTRTGYGSPNDQWSRDYRDIAAAMLHDQAMYLMFGGRAGRSRRWAAPKRETMLAQVQRGIDHINSRLEPLDGQFTRWVAGWWPGTINYAHDYYEPGFYDRLIEMDQADNPLTRPPMMRPGHRFIRVFPDPQWGEVDSRDENTFLVARFDDYAAVIYTGPIGRTRYMNFAGGGLSTFWMPDGGSILLGRTGNPVHPERTQQSWEHWRVWPTHAISGMTPDGDVFTSARLRRRMAQVEYTVQDQEARAVIRGPIGAEHDGSRTAQNKCIKGQVRYERQMDLTPQGVRVVTTLTSDGTDQVAELYEVLPLFLREARRQPEVPHRIWFDVGDTPVEASDTFVDGVTQVRVERFGATAVIVFDQPQRVGLAPEVWADQYQSRVTARNLLIDLLGDAAQPVALPSVTVQYEIRPDRGSQ